MSLIRIEHNPRRGQLNLFGAIWLVFFGILGGVVFWRSGSPAAAGSLWTVAIVVPVVGRIVPEFARVVYVGMSYLAWPIGFAISLVVLAMVFYLVLTPIGLLMRLFGYAPVDRRPEEQAETYWRPRKEPESIGRYFRQF